MLTSYRKKSAIVKLFSGGIVFFALLALCLNPVFASEGSIARSNYYPENGEKLQIVNNFLFQTTGVNTNTTVSVSIDGGTPIPMTYLGIRTEIVPGDTVACEWYSWQIYVPAMATPGEHTFQFFSHYYVWQSTDQYWASFNFCSNLQTFTIIGSNQTSALSSVPTEPSTIALKLVPPQSDATPARNAPDNFLYMGLAGLAVISLLIFSATSYQRKQN